MVHLINKLNTEFANNPCITGRVRICYYPVSEQVVVEVDGHCVVINDYLDEQTIRMAISVMLR